MKTAVINADIVCRDRIIKNGTCVFENGIITSVANETPVADEIIDAKGGYLIPGFVDIHCHCGIGKSFMGGDVSDFKAISDFHLSHGTTTLVATTCTSDDEETAEMLETCAEYMKHDENPTVAGVFMEGPWLNPAQCGAQAVSCMKKPSADEIRALKAKYPHILRVGAAPELDGGMEFGRACAELGVVASVAHTDATFKEIEEALKNGYTVMTHLYSGMKLTERVSAYRIAGAVEAGLYFDELYTEVIADGKHLPLELLKLIYKCKGADRICLVTDASRGAGLPDGSVTTGISRADKDQIIIEDGVAKMPDRKSFAGSTATADRLYRTMASAIGNDLIALSKMASLTPSRAMGFTDRGEIAEGKRADMLILDRELEIKKIIFGGKEI